MNYKLRQKTFKLVVLFHNLSGFDGHFILKVANIAKHGKITCIPKTSERYISFSIGNLVFKDSASFLNDSMEGKYEHISEAKYQFYIKFVLNNKQESAAYIIAMQSNIK